MKEDPCQEAIIFASMANSTYLTNFMPPQSITVIPKLGNDPARRYSSKACRWLAWVGRDKRLRHALNGGKVKIGPYIVDGFEVKTRTVYEFYVCYWHGCPIFYSDFVSEKHPHHVDCTYQTLHEHTLRREYALKNKDIV